MAPWGGSLENNTGSSATWDPNSPTLAGLKSAISLGVDVPIGTEILDKWDGNDSPLIVAQKLDDSNNSAYGGAKGYILLRKYVEPVSQVFGSTNVYSSSTAKEFLDTDYLNKCSDALKETISLIAVPSYNGSISALQNTKWFLVSAYEMCNQGNGVSSYEGVMWDYFKQVTGLSSPDGQYTASNGRKFINRSGSQGFTWTRSKASSGVWCVNGSNGMVTDTPPSYAYGILPACFIAGK